MTIIQSCPDSLANKLFSSKLLSDEVLDQVITGQDPNGKKASRILHTVSTYIKADPEKVLNFIRVLEEEPSFDDLIKEIHGKHLILSCRILHAH